MTTTLLSADADLNATAGEIERLLGPNVVIKPLNQGSALGVQLLPNGGDITAALAQCLAFGSCLVEPFITWPRGHCRHPRNTKWQQSPPCN